MRGFPVLSLAVAIGLGAKVASAEDTEIEIANARQLAIQGIDAVEGGNCKTGEPLLVRAEKLHHATVHLQYIARCRLAAGHLVAATEMWRQILREGAPSGSSPAVQAAIAEANTQLPRTLPRLASTTLRTSADYHDIKVMLDGTPVPSELLGAQQVIDPGDHTLEADAPGYAHFSKQWTVGEGKTAEVVISLAPGAPGGRTETPGAPEKPDEVERKGSPLTTAGIVVGAVGLAAMVGGTVTLLTWKNKEDTIRSQCTLPNQGCDPRVVDSTTLEDEKQSVHSLVTATNILMFGGGALLAGGVTLIVLGATSGHDQPKTALAFGAPNAGVGLSIRGAY